MLTLRTVGMPSEPPTRESLGSGSCAKNGTSTPPARAMARHATAAPTTRWAPSSARHSHGRRSVEVSTSASANQWAWSTTPPMRLWIDQRLRSGLAPVSAASSATPRPMAISSSTQDRGGR